MYNNGAKLENDTEHCQWIPKDNNSYHKQPITNGHLCV